MIVVAGTTGDLGLRIIGYLLNKGAEVRVLIRPESKEKKVRKLEGMGAKIFRLHNWTKEEILPACLGANCVVSAVAGLQHVVIDTQKVLLDAAVAAKVPRFIP